LVATPSSVEELAAAPQEKFYVNLCGVSLSTLPGKCFAGDALAGRATCGGGCLNQAIVKEILGARRRKGEATTERQQESADHFLRYVARLAAGSERRKGARQNDVRTPRKLPAGPKLTLDSGKPGAETKSHRANRGAGRPRPYRTKISPAPLLPQPICR
jgi:hypothetical protein